MGPGPKKAESEDMNYKDLSSPQDYPIIFGLFVVGEAGLDPA